MCSFFDRDFTAHEYSSAFPSGVLAVVGERDALPAALAAAGDRETRSPEHSVCTRGGCRALP